MRIKQLKSYSFAPFLLIIFIAFGFFLRTYHLKDSFFFGHDQARDIQEVYEMISTPKLKLVGPGTDIPGLFSGPLYYYFLAIPFFISQYNPNAAAFALILVNCVGITLIYSFGTALKDKRLGLIAALLWAISYEQANYSRFISNPSPLPVTTTLFFFGCYLFFIRSRKVGLSLSVIGLAASIHLDFYLVYLLGFYPIFYFMFKPKEKIRTYIGNALFLTLLCSTFIIAELKFKGMGSHSFITYIVSQSGWNDIISSLSLFLFSFSKSLSYSFFGLNNFIALFLFSVAIIYLFTQTKLNSSFLFLLTWLFSTLPLFAFRSNVVGGNFIHSSILGATTICVAWAILFLIDQKRQYAAFFIILIIASSNLYLFAKDNFESRIIFSHQPMKYSEEKALIDYTYQASNYKPFSICALSNPLFVNQLWSSAYKIYGEQKYSYLPLWSGPKQELNKTFLLNDKMHTKIRYLIIEPSDQLPSFAARTTIYAEDKVSRIIEEKKIGQLLVQKRIALKQQENPINSQHLTPQEQQESEQILKQDYRYSCWHIYN